jgi:hypothetical protein
VLDDEFRFKYKMPPGRKVQTDRTAEMPTGNLKLEHWEREQQVDLRGADGILVFWWSDVRT